MVLKRGFIFSIFLLVTFTVLINSASSVSAWTCTTNLDCVPCTDPQHCGPENYVCEGNNLVHNTNICVGGYCQPASSSTDCDNGLYCDGSESCSAGACVQGTPIVCDNPSNPLCYSSKGACDEQTDSCDYSKSLDITGPVITALSVTKIPEQCKIKIDATAEDQCTPIITGEFFVGGSDCGLEGTGESFDSVTPIDVGLIANLVENGYSSGIHDGSINIFVRAKDDNGEGNWGACQSANVQLDCLPPEYPTCELGNTNYNGEPDGIVLNGTCSPKEKLVCGNNPKIEANICDTESRIQLAEYFLDDMPLLNWHGINMAASDGTYDEKCEDVQATIDLSQLSEGTHYVELHGKDGQENWGKFSPFVNTSFIKDTLPPVTTKTISFADGAYKTCDIKSAMGHDLDSEKGCYYVKPGTQITLNATDPDTPDHEYAGNPIINYNVWYSEDCTISEPTWTLQSSGTGEPNEAVELSLTQDSCHLIEYWASDGCYNAETHHYELDIVDSKAPVTTKEVTGTFVKGDENPVDYFLGSQSLITLTCEDQSPHPVGGEILNWQIFWKEDCNDDETSWEQIWEGSSDSGIAEIRYKESSCHKLIYWCEDALGNTEEPQTEIDAVDVTPPIIEKDVIGPQSGTCPPEPNAGQTNPNGYCYVDNATVINVTAYDPTPHPSGLDSCWYYYEVYRDFEDYYKEGVGTRYPQEGYYTTFPIQFPQESIHELYLYCNDSLGNTKTDVETFVVDHSAPNTIKSFDGPQFSCSDWCYAEYGGEGYSSCLENYCTYQPDEQLYLPLWITSDTQINLQSTDPVPHPSGVANTFYRITQVDRAFCDSYMNDESEVSCDDAQGIGKWNIYDESFQIPEDSCHLIEYYAVDNVDKTETINKQCVFVDNEPPATNKTIGDPKFICDVLGKCGDDEETEWQAWFVTNHTPITLSCNDVQPHPVGHEQLCFKISWDLEEGVRDITKNYAQGQGYWTDDEYYCVAPNEDGKYTFNFLEDSLHNIEWYCKDALGNQNEAQIEWDNVDDVPPTIIVRNPTQSEASDVNKCVQSIVVSISDAKSGINDSSVVAGLWNSDGVSVKNVTLKKQQYGNTFTYEGLMEKDLPAGEYTLIITAKDNLGNENSVSVNEYLPEVVNVEYISPSTCLVDPINGGSCDFTFNLCMRGGNTIEFWMDKLGNIVTPAMLNATTLDPKDMGWTFVGLKHIVGTDPEQCNPELDEEWDEVNGVCWFKTDAGDLSLENSCVDITGRAQFKLHLNLTSEAVQAIGEGVQDLNYWIKSSLMCELPTPD